MTIHTDIQAYCSLHALLDRYVPAERREIQATLEKRHSWGDSAMVFITGGDFIAAVNANGFSVQQLPDVERLDHNCVLIHVDV
jgi:hypothetical protein